MGAIFPLFVVAFAVFTLSGLQIASEQASALVMSAAFILAVLAVSILSRLWRSTELRFEGFTFVDGESKEAWGRLCESDFPILIPIRPGGDSLVHKEQEIRTLHRIPNTLPIMFAQATVGDSSDFSQAPTIRVTHENGRVLIQIMRCVSVPHALAAATLELSSKGSVPEVHFGWSNENPITANIHFVLFGSGNVPWMVYNLIQRAQVERKPRVFVG